MPLPSRMEKNEIRRSIEVCRTILIDFFDHLFQLRRCRRITDRSHHMSQIIRTDHSASEAIEEGKRLFQL